jgi:predicted metal-dependent HD superfamily phosphohydrolase
LRAEQDGAVERRERWDRAWASLAVATPPAAVLDALVACYSEPHRAYHTLRHLEECFAHLAPVRGECTRPAEVELALWFHDAIYDPRGSENEERSAEWAESVVRAAGASPAAAERVRDLVLATRHDAIPESGDAKVLVDVDLSILGASVERFAEYETQVRREYEWVPEAAFCAARAKILRELVARPAIYSTAWFRDRLEPAARRNLQHSIARLAAAGTVVNG